jgi:hypothetical protein
MKTPLQVGAALCLCLPLAAGCRLMHGEADPQGNTLLKPARPSPDSVRMEIIWARFPANHPALHSEAWQEIDETRLDPAVHRELANNGLRVGIINGKLPEELSRALNQREPFTNESTTIDGETNELLADPIVRGRVRQMPRDQRYEIVASDIHATLPLLKHDQGEWSGRTYENAQAIYAIRVSPQGDQTALVELTPELHYGEARMRMTGGDEGVWHQAMRRDREVFDRMRISVKLAAGDMLVIMALPEAGSRLGHYIHTVDSSDGPQQKMILIRLADVPRSDAFASLDK